jgi:hypothetical protein
VTHDRAGILYWSGLHFQKTEREEGAACYGSVLDLFRVSLHPRAISPEGVKVIQT